MLRPIGIFDFLEGSDVVQLGDLCRGTLNAGKTSELRIQPEEVEWRHVSANHIGMQCKYLPNFEFIRVVEGDAV